MKAAPNPSSAGLRRTAIIGIPCAAAVAIVPVLLIAWGQGPKTGRPLVTQPIPEPISTKPVKRLNQAPDNFEKGLAIPSGLALNRPGKDKIAFLTFDDGPSPVTQRVLAILQKNKIKATFFVVGRMAEHYPEMLKKTFAAGHAIANHSYTHDYKLIYRTPWTMIAEIIRTENALEKILGPTFRTKLFRFPGGYMGVRSVFQHHKEKYAAAIKDCGMAFIDWNVDCGDTMPHTQTAKQLINRVLGEATGQNRVVVLMHDAGAKERTADALPRIIAGLKKRGFVFRTLR